MENDWKRGSETELMEKASKDASSSGQDAVREYEEKAMSKVTGRPDGKKPVSGAGRSPRVALVLCDSPAA